MRRLAACLVLGLVVVGVATAARGDPKKQITRADEARAKAMLLREADVGAAFKASRSSVSKDDFYCKAADESDLVQTGDAESPEFEKADSVNRTYLSVLSEGQVYKTATENAASWRRWGSAAGWKCLELLWRRAATQGGSTFVSFRKITFPRLAPETIAYRSIARTPGNTAVISDVVGFMNGQAQSYLTFVGAPSAYPRSEQILLGRIVARRMASAMRRG